MGLGRMTAMAGALMATQATAEGLTPAAQTTERYPFQEEMRIIQETRDAALALCEEDEQTRLAQLRAVIDRGTVTDRDALIAIIEDMGAPEGGVDDNTDRELIRGAISMSGTNAAVCEREAYEVSTESLAAIQATLEDNMAALRAQTLEMQELLGILTALEQFANGEAEIQLEIRAMREEILRLDADTAATRERSVEYARQIEAIWDRIARGTTT